MLTLPLLLSKHNPILRKYWTPTTIYGYKAVFYGYNLSRFPILTLEIAIEQPTKSDLP